MNEHATPVTGKYWKVCDDIFHSRFNGSLVITLSFISQLSVGFRQPLNTALYDGVTKCSNKKGRFPFNHLLLLLPSSSRRLLFDFSHESKRYLALCRLHRQLQIANCICLVHGRAAIQYIQSYVAHVIRLCSIFNAHCKYSNVIPFFPSFSSHFAYTKWVCESVLCKRTQNKYISSIEWWNVRH